MIVDRSKNRHQQFGAVCEKTQKDQSRKKQFVIFFLYHVFHSDSLLIQRGDLSGDQGNPRYADQKIDEQAETNRALSDRLNTLSTPQNTPDPQAGSGDITDSESARQAASVAQTSRALPPGVRLDFSGIQVAQGTDQSPGTSFQLGGLLAKSRQKSRSTPPGPSRLMRDLALRRPIKRSSHIVLAG